MSLVCAFPIPTNHGPYKHRRSTERGKKLVLDLQDPPDSWPHGRCRLSLMRRRSASQRAKPPGSGSQSDAGHLQEEQRPPDKIVITALKSGWTKIKPPNTPRMAARVPMKLGSRQDSVWKTAAQQVDDRDRLSQLGRLSSRPPFARPHRWHLVDEEHAQQHDDRHSHGRGNARRRIQKWSS